MTLLLPMRATVIANDGAKKVLLPITELVRVLPEEEPGGGEGRRGGTPYAHFF